MKLFLCSHFSSVGSLIKEEIENKKVAFIPTAPDAASSGATASGATPSSSSSATSGGNSTSGKASPGTGDKDKDAPKS